jgi:hypothetical protein
VKHELEKTQLNAPARYVGGDALPGCLADRHLLLRC